MQFLLKKSVIVVSNGNIGNLGHPTSLKLSWNTMIMKCICLYRIKNYKIKDLKKKIGNEPHMSFSYWTGALSIQSFV